MISDLIYNLTNDSPICNKCGKMVNYFNKNIHEINKQINSFHEFSVKYEYPSPKDETTEQFILCEDCIKKFTSKFKIPIRRQEYQINENYFVDKQELKMILEGACK